MNLKNILKDDIKSLENNYEITENGNFEGNNILVEKKLSNERFVSNAPEKVIELERKKATDAQEKITLLEKSLDQL